MWGWLKALITPVATLIGDPINEWQKRKTVKVQNQFKLDEMVQKIKLTALETQLKMAEQGQKIDYNLDKIAMENMNKSWKDEFILLVFIIPMLMAFTSFSNIALNGFNIIQKMPNWYISLIVGMVVVIYGMRGLLTKFIDSKTNFFKGK